MSDFFLCSECGKSHPATTIELSFKRAHSIAELSEDERIPDRCKESDDLSALWGSCDSEHRFFVRGVMPFSVREQNRDYSLGVWVEVEKKSFDRILELWNAEDQSDEPPFDGHLANLIPLHENTIGLPVDVRLTGPKTRPQFFVRQSAHMLYLEQVHGVSAHQAAQYTALVI